VSPSPSYMNLTAEDLKDPNLSKINKMFRELVDEINRLSGLNGTITVGANLNLQKKFKVINSA
jgi:hypothetical protein